MPLLSLFSLFPVAQRRILAALVLSGAAGVASAACSASPGATCNAGAELLASQPLGTDVNLGAGNPINVINGNKYQREEDMPALPGVMGLEIVRHYNSSLSGTGDWTGRVGRGWRLSYETRLIASPHTIEIEQADGARLVFSRDVLRPTVATPDDPAHGAITTRRVAQGEEFLWRWADGRELSFNYQGQLMQIKAATGEITSLMYDPKGPLVRVTDPQGRSMSLSYLDRPSAVKGDRFRGVQSIQTPVGRFSYEYGSVAPQGLTLDPRYLLANLVRVRYPLEGQGRQYHYEDAVHPTFMTGISIEGAGADGKQQVQRYATYGYNAAGKGILSTHANGVDKVTFDFEKNGVTTITNSLGQKTTYRYAGAAGNYRLVEVRGAGCSLCGPANRRYRYDGFGRLVETLKLDAQGMPLDGTLTDFDQQGRPLRVNSVFYNKGKAGVPRLLARYEYSPGAGPKPRLIARPSVVPGREFVTRIDYGDGSARGLPVAISESGYVPGFGAQEAPRLVSRAVHYRYDARGRTIESDGPLANAKSSPGPENSDISRNNYDPATGLLRRVVEPGGYTTEIVERDAALRPILIRSTDGYIEKLTRVRNNWRGQPDEISVTAGPYTATGAGSAAGTQSLAGNTLTRVQHYRYDAQGRLASVTRPGNLTTSYRYDAAGRLTHTILPDGSQLVAGADTEGRRASELRYTGADASSLLSATRFSYKEGERMVEISDDVGLRQRVAYTERGQLARLDNALDVSARFTYDEQGRLVGRTDAAGSADAADARMAYDGRGNATTVTDAQGTVTERRYDDFGNKVIEANADRGVMVLVYDVANQPVARIDDTGSATRYRYDSAGRLLGVSADNGPEFRLHRYHGRQLTETISTPDGTAEHAVERFEYQYDGLGQVVSERRWLARATDGAAGVPGAPGLTFVTTSRYDAAGRVTDQVLPDGHQLHYQYADGAAGGRGHAGQLLAILFDQQVVVGDIAQTVIGGLTGYTNGNGIGQRISFDQRGRMRELVAQAGAAPPMAPDAGWFTRWSARFDTSAPAGATPLYRQVNTYDGADRLARIQRSAGAGALERDERYEYDDMNRLTLIADGAGGKRTLRYDRAGNRVEETVEPGNAPVLMNAALSSGGQTGAEPEHRRYRYAPGSNRLLGMSAEPLFATQEPVASGVAWRYHSTGIPLAKLAFDGATSRTVMHRVEYNAARRPVAVYDRSGRPLARYHYNAQGERVAKTTYDANGRPLTRYSLYQQQLLAADTDADGRITAHYIYLYGKPVAKIAMEPDSSLIHRAWHAVTRTDGARVGRVYAVHTDHLGTPQMVTDDAAAVVWQAQTDPFGKAKVAATRDGGHPFEMNLRLPGQVYDAETGLNQNYYRDYDSQLGRYTTPDPMGLAGGLNPYTYVNSNPLTKIDPQGLYESDIHYYMTFVLALAAGIDQPTARRIALATQYVDDNPLTTPMPSGLTEDSMLNNHEALLKYHFVMPPGGDASTFGQSSEQLDKLYGASVTAAKAGNENACWQFLGEYLHSFEDTYAHRDPNNASFNPIVEVNIIKILFIKYKENKELGLGHGLYMHDPDYTYDHVGIKLGEWVPDDGGTVKLLPTLQKWNVNAARTMAMEAAVFEKLSMYGDKNKAKTLEKVQEALKGFTDIRENDGDNDATFPKKIAFLTKALAKLGITGVDLRDADKYDKDDGKENRDEAVKGLEQSDYVGTLLPKK